MKLAVAVHACCSVINFVGNMWCIFRDIGCGAVLLAEMPCEGHSRSSGLIYRI